MSAAPVEWQVATVQSIRSETPRVKTFTLKLPRWRPHRAGQHYDLRLTAEDGYQAQRSYSIASPPERTGEIDLTVERIEGGEVSPYLHDVVMTGDQIEVRGPIGGYFVWEPMPGQSLLLIGGGSGIVPLMSMLRHHAERMDDTPVALLGSWRSFDDIIYQDELETLQQDACGPKVFHTLTRSQPPGWRGYSRRIDRKMLTEVIRPLPEPFQVYICGPTPMVEAASAELVGLGIPPGSIRTERFGPSAPGQGS